MRGSSALIAIKALHTAIWLFFVGCIVGAPLAAWHGDFRLAGWLIGLVAIEGLVLLVNRWTCPLTNLAARHTRDRVDNFDIYLPPLLARNTKRIFTPLYLLGAVYTALAWWRAS